MWHDARITIWPDLGPTWLISSKVGRIGAGPCRQLSKSQNCPNTGLSRTKHQALPPKASRSKANLGLAQGRIAASNGLLMYVRWRGGGLSCSEPPASPWRRQTPPPPPPFFDSSARPAFPRPHPHLATTGPHVDLTQTSTCRLRDRLRGEVFVNIRPGLDDVGAMSIEPGRSLARKRPSSRRFRQRDGPMK